MCVSSSEESQTVSVRSNPFTRRSEITGTEEAEFGPPPELSERYRVVGALGRGGVGVVYRGWDEELGRPVAIKFLRPDRPEKERDDSVGLAGRLRRESMALAALSHPNVVAVYDVVEGKDGVGIVMELIEGVDLRTWLRATKRDTEEILDVFIQAGRGLEAAHAGGLVHRDFKPGNVMVGDDGRVRVLDFGLARLVAAHPSQPTRHSGRHIVVSKGTRTDGVFTDHGTVMGTPAYMAPEQIDGLLLDARSDQFSYCVALYEALSGARPFDVRSLRERRKAIDAGPTPLMTVSRRLRDAIGQGLQADPDARYPSMRALIDVLERERRPTPKAWWIAGLGLVGVGAAIGLTTKDPAAPCGVTDPREASWNDAKRGEVQAAFAAVDAPFAADAWTKTEATLEAYVERWGREREAACALEVIDPRRLACLGRVRTRFDAVVDIFANADADVVENALGVMRRLPEPSACEERKELDDPELQALHARAVALMDSAQYEDAKRTADSLLAKAVAADNAAYEAIGLLITGSCMDELGDYDEAIEKLEDAYFIAVRLGAHRTALEAALDAAGAAGMGARRAEEGRTWIRHARSQLQRIEDAEALQAQILVVEGGIALMAGDLDEGLKLLEEAHAIYVRLNGEDDVESVNVLNNIGLAYQEMGRFEEALGHHVRARDLFSALNGPEHPSVANADHAIAACQGSLGRTDEAVETYQRVIARWEKTLGPTHPRVAMAFYNIGHVHQMADQFEQALAAYMHAISLLEESMGRDHVNTAMAVHNAGSIHHELKQLDEAQEYLERSLAAFESAEVNPLYLAINRFELAMVLHERDLEPDRVKSLIEASRGAMANGGAFEQQELEGVKAWIRDNRPDLATP